MAGGKKSKEYFMTCKTQISVSINKVSVEGSHTHSLACFLWLLLCYKKSIKAAIVATKTVWAAKLNIFITWPLTENISNP